MSDVAKLLIIFIVMVSAAGCREGVVRPAPAPDVVRTTQTNYVPIDPELTKRCPWPKDAPLNAVIEVARQRKFCLEKYESQLDGIDAVEGGPAPEAKK